MTTSPHPPPAPAGLTRCRFTVARGSDILFRRSIDLATVPRVDESVQISVGPVETVRGKVRSVRWVIPEDDSIVIDIQIELGGADRRRFATRAPLQQQEPPPPDT